MDNLRKWAAAVIAIELNQFKKGPDQQWEHILRRVGDFLKL